MSEISKVIEGKVQGLIEETKRKFDYAKEIADKAFQTEKEGDLEFARSQVFYYGNILQLLQDLHNKRALINSVDIIVENFLSRVKRVDKEMTQELSELVVEHILESIIDV